MNLAETSDVLAKVKVGDNREVDANGYMIREWHHVLGHLPVDVVMEAVRMHRTNSTEYLGTAHIVANAAIIYRRLERDKRIAVAKLGIIAAPVITLDRAKFEAETQASIREHRIARGADPDTGKPVAP